MARLKRTEMRVRMGGREITLSNLDKPLYPSGFKKRDVLDYYAKIAPAVLPHLKNRPFTFKRFPEGTAHGFFYEKQCPSHKPDWVPTVRVERKLRVSERPIDYCLINEPAALVWAANLASLELHVLLSRAEHLERPTAVAFDLDPGAPAGILDCAAAALKLRRILDDLHLMSYPKTSGAKGIHVYVPLNTPVTFEETKLFAHAIALWMERASPAKVTANMSKAVRPGKVFVDWSQNDDHKTTVCAYSLRALEWPSVSTPLRWEELERALEKKDARLLEFQAADVVARVRKQGDLFLLVLKEKQKLPSLATEKAA